MLSVHASHYMHGACAQAFLVEHDANAVEFVGNRTECALLMMLRGWGVGYEALRKEHRVNVLKVFAFTSERKMASVVARTGPRGGLRLYNKVWPCAANSSEQRDTKYLEHVMLTISKVICAAFTSEQKKKPT